MTTPSPTDAPNDPEVLGPGGAPADSAGVDADGEPDEEGSGGQSGTQRRAAQLRGMVGGQQAHVFRGSVWVIAAVVVNAVSGFAFWWVAASLRSQDEVGLAAELFSATLFVIYATGMGLPIAVARFASDKTDKADVLFTLAVVYTTVTSLVGAIAFLLLAPPTVADTLFEVGRPLGTLLLFLTVAGMSMALLVETRLMTLRLWGWVVGRVVLVGIIRFPLLLVQPLGEDRNGLWLFFLVVGTPALSGFVGAIVLRSRHRLLPTPAETRPALRYATVNYLGLLASQAPQFILPLIVVVNVEASEYATFFLAWQITAVIMLLPHTIGQVVLAEGSKRGADITRQLRLGLSLALGLMSVIAVGAIAFRGIVPILLGSDYDETADLLVPLVVAGVPWAVTSLSLARARVRNNSFDTVIITVSFALAVLVPAVIYTTPNSGAVPATRAWLFGNALAAVVGAATVVLDRPLQRFNRRGGTGRRPRSDLDPASVSTPTEHDSE